MTRPRKILLILNSLVAGGAERHVVSLVNGFDTERFRLSLVYLKNQEDLLSQMNQKHLEHLLCCNAKRGFDSHAVRILARHIQEYAPDVILCTNQYAMFYGYMARVMSGKKCILMDAFHTTELPASAKSVPQLLYRWLFRQCDQVVFVSRKQQEYWLSAGLRPRKYQYIHNGVDPDYFQDNFTLEYKQDFRQQLGFSGHDYIVGICAALRPEKNHLEFLRALTQVRDRGVAVKALIIGDGPLRQEVEEFIAKQNLRDDVRIVGFQPDVRPFISACDCMVLNSVAVETFSIAILESMSLGKPVISSDIGGVSEQIEHGKTGLLFKKRDTGALANHMIQLSDRTLRDKMGLAAREMILQKFTLKQMLKAYEELLLGNEGKNVSVAKNCPA